MSNSQSPVVAEAEGSIVGSLEFCTGKLGAQLVLVLGHTQCGAVAGATKTSRRVQGTGQCPRGPLAGLGWGGAAGQRGLGPRGSGIAHAVKVNIFHSMNFLLQFSEPRPGAQRSITWKRAAWSSWAARHSKLSCCPPSANAGNTCTHAEGCVLGSLEFCTGALNTRLIFVLGHTACGAIKGATKAFLEPKKSGGAKKDGFNSCNASGEVLLNRDSLRKLAVASGSLFCSLHVCRMAMRWTRCCGA